MVLLGFLATRGVNAHGADGLLYGGGFGQLGRQALATVVTIGFSGTLTFGIAWAIQQTIGLRVTPEAEWDGIDEAEHAESAYELGTLGGRHTALSPGVPAPAGGGRRVAEESGAAPG